MPAPGSMFVQRKCACGGTPGPTGECAECRRKRMLGMQPQLQMSLPGDRSEREADRVAASVLAPIGTEISDAGPLVQRSASQNGPVEAPSLVHEVASEPGAPIDSVTRSHMERRLGHDFSRVRIHTGARASQSARSLNARAYTMGSHVVFAGGEYRPQEPDGIFLLAHELAHVVQQRGSGSTAPSPAPMVQRAPPAAAAAGAAAVAVGRVVLACIVGAAVSFGIERFIIQPISDWITGKESEDNVKKCRQIIAAVIGCVSGGLGSILFRWFLREAAVTGPIAETFLEHAILWLMVKGITVPSSIVAGLHKLGCVSEEFMDEVSTTSGSGSSSVPAERIA